MAWPPAAYPLGTSTGNATAAKDVHPALHNNAAQAINDIVDKINATPPGTSIRPTWVGLMDPTQVSGSQTSLANQAKYQRVVIPADMTVAGLTVFNGSTVNGNIDVGIYADNAGVPGARLASSGSKVASGVTTYVTYNFTAPLDLAAGDVVWLALAVDSSTTTLARTTVSFAGLLVKLIYEQSAAFPLPSSAVAFPTAASVIHLLGVPLP